MLMLRCTALLQGSWLFSHLDALQIKATKLLVSLPTDFTQTWCAVMLGQQHVTHTCIPEGWTHDATTPKPPGTVNRGTESDRGKRHIYAAREAAQKKRQSCVADLLCKCALCESHKAVPTHLSALRMQGRIMARTCTHLLHGCRDRVTAMAMTAQMMRTSTIAQHSRRLRFFI